ncbi:Uncharacterized protein OS=Chthoniobacter flavus Ellin428 GN=CfE428DRAFT_2833 PE=4 SV=1: DUF2149 [Gemmata massiliana]|uniref:DUF2149 domain-containing protein n=1 Tax=Gemmata massiliana TaxID=1210884 RepID=A0A6P2D6P1_9BACT|nr:DUF2149 domain-containing protein [Gemmata massiliana]VTR96673.1 Uncharacterized protein OS=Chthoniobacter flavus Ellin428 GN=CfE428DRAFT_2833 PE=4 SV=1: DUF2149 [Gemmata massiliana]
MRRKRKWDREDDDPAAGLLNLFDIWLVFAVSLLLAALTYSQAARPDSATPVKNPGEPDMEIVNKQGQEIETLRMTDRQLTGEGQKLGTAYRLKSGKVVYVPETGKK